MGFVFDKLHSTILFNSGSLVDKTELHIVFRSAALLQLQGADLVVVCFFSRASLSRQMVIQLDETLCDVLIVSVNNLILSARQLEF